MSARKAKLISGVVLAIALPYILAFLAFPKPEWKLAEPDDFGTFGDFVGGMLNPMLSFASLMAILYTLSVQRKESRKAEEDRRNDQEFAKAEFNHIRQEAELNEINRIMKANEDELDRVLSKDVKIITGNAGNTYDGKFRNYFNWINMNFDYKKGRVYGTFLKESQIRSRIFIWTGEMLSFLNDCLQEYEKIKPNSLIIRYYRSKYMTIARPMYFLGYIDRENVSMLLSEDDLGTEPLDPFLM